MVLPHLAFRRGPDAGVVAQHVDRTERVERRVAQRLERRELGDVGDDTDDVATLVAQLGRRSPSTGFGVDVGDDHAHALVGEPFDERATDAARAAGDDRDLAGELLHETAFGLGTPAGGASSYSTNSTR